ncbi:MFS transporter [Acetobacter thailandicus]|uniref:MFS transporter n=1 Tax=Acetobacter thailandicus TaxID=1502842 RepID=UPI001BACD6F8|nr:MFS transporter [Acetobacter thailandicus]MBS1004124.1 MFS transporter [Acetobacter thailandicus]
MSSAQVKSSSALKSILPVVLFTLFCYIVIGLQMAVTPLFVHEKLGFSSAMAGFAVSVQYLATFATRADAGRRIDSVGPKKVVLTGLLTGVLCGLLIALSGMLATWPYMSLTALLAGRITLGFAESWVATSVIVWNIRRAGAENTAQVISWNGVCSYGGIALGAPVAIFLYYQHALGLLTGFGMVGILCAVLMGTGFPLAFMKPAVPPMATQKKQSFFKTLSQVWPYGATLASGSVGFGAISALLTLYFAHRNWSGAAVGLSLFGTLFVLTRFAFTRQIAKHGGVTVALVSLFVEALGLSFLAWAPSAFWACTGAGLSGVGFSLLFPSLGVGVVNRVSEESRGAAIGAFSVFLDIAIAVSGPLLGFIIPLWGYGVLFYLTAVCCLAGVGMCVALNAQAKRS